MATPETLGAKIRCLVEVLVAQDFGHFYCTQGGASKPALQTLPVVSLQVAGEWEGSIWE
jgi:hypothetical protein